jgi:tRNA-dihydrouridine synthase
MLAGPALDSLEALLAATERPVIASGGVSSLDDLRALMPLAARGLEGVIVGKALYAGRFTVAEALATLAAVGGGSGGLKSEAPAQALGRQAEPSGSPPVDGGRP